MVSSLQESASEPKPAPYATGPIDLVLIYPPWPVLDDRAILQNSLPPLGILSIASYAMSEGYRVKVYDVHGEKLNEQEVRSCRGRSRTYADEFCD